MSDLIDRQAALNALCDKCDLVKDKVDCFYLKTDSCYERNAIANLPAAELERKRGEWIKQTDTICGCTNCKQLTRMEMLFGDMVLYRYCPNCGADMRTNK